MKGMASVVMLLAAAGLSAGAEVSKEPDAAPAAIGIKVGTLGFGGELTLDLGRFFDLRSGVNFGWHKTTVHLDEADVEGDIRWLTVPILIDWHPLAGGFRISGGAVINKNKIELSADPREPIELNGTDYVIEGLDGEVTFREFCPYLGIGYGDACGRDGRVHFACDFGILFHGEPEVTARARTNAGPEYQAMIDRDLQAEVDELEDDIGGFKYYPVISLGFSIAF